MLVPAAALELCLPVFLAGEVLYRTKAGAYIPRPCGRHRYRWTASRAGPACTFRGWWAGRLRHTLQSLAV
jgi:hypothetical protein